VRKIVHSAPKAIGDVLTAVDGSLWRVTAVEPFIEGRRWRYWLTVEKVVA